jgi:hypothetical protein
MKRTSTTACCGHGEAANLGLWASRGGGGRGAIYRGKRGVVAWYARQVTRCQDGLWQRQQRYGLGSGAAVGWCGSWDKHCAATRLAGAGPKGRGRLGRCACWKWAGLWAARVKSWKGGWLRRGLQGCTGNKERKEGKGSGSAGGSWPKSA